MNPPLRDVSCRRAFLRTSAGALPALLCGQTMAFPPERTSLTKGPAEAAHTEIWRRFVTADHGTLLGRAALQSSGVGSTISPFNDIFWRFLNQHWITQGNCDAALQLARTQLPKWAEHNPRSPWEDDCMGEPLFAAWTISLSADSDVIEATRSHVAELLSTYEWRGLYTSLFFIAVAVHYQTELHDLEFTP